MARGLAATIVPAAARSPRAWRRSWMLGYSAAVVARVRTAEEHAASSGDDDRPDGPSTALVLADRALTVRRRCEEAYPNTRRTRVTYTGNGYHAGFREGQKADIGGSRIRPGAAGALVR